MSLICLVTAMTAEAKPLIQAFNLQPLPQRGLSAWMGDGLCLVQTGMGKQRTEARLEAMVNAHPGIDAFINVGIAGGDRALGDVIIASSVSDRASGRRWYPHLLPRKHDSVTPHTQVTTVDEPCRDYQPNTVYEMEASAVFQFGSQHTDLSRIQTVKVISDNPSHPLDDFSVKHVPAWMQNSLPCLENLVEWMSTETQNLQTHEFQQRVYELTDHITRVCHHSTTQTYQLRRLIERHLALTGQVPSLESLGQLDSSHQLIRRLENEIHGLAVNY